MGWFPEFEKPEYQARLEKKIEDEARSWNQYVEERVEFQAERREEDEKFERAVCK